MPLNKTSFDDRWMTDTRFSTWIEKADNVYEAKCNLCKKTFAVDNSGIAQVLQHAGTQRHISLTSSLSTQPRFSFSSGTLSLDSAGLRRVLSVEDQVARAEILFLLRLIKHNHCFASNSDLVSTLRIAFNDPIINNMTLGSTKTSYSICFGLGPHFHEELLNDMKNTWYSLLVDEATTEQNIKQLDMHVRYWSNTRDCISRRYFTSAFLGHARAQDMHDVILNALSADSIPLTKMLQLGCDGPNVNKSLQDKLNESSVKFGGKALINIGSCDIHTIHNSFKKGLESVEESWSVEDFLNDVFNFFKKYPSRREDFAEIQASLNSEKQSFKRFVNNRWLSMGPVCARIIEQWNCLKKYFLTENHDKSLKSSNAFKRICLKLQEDNVMLARLTFLYSLAQTFEPTLTVLQAEKPLIHVLHDQLIGVLRLLLNRFVKADTLEGKVGSQLADIPLDCKPTELCDFGVKTRELLHSLKAKKNPKLALLEKYMLKVLTTSAQYLQKKLPLKNVLLQNIRCLNPSLRKEQMTNQMILSVLLHIPHVSSEPNVADKIAREWHIYQHDTDILESWSQDANIDQYWAHIFKLRDVLGQPKYPNLCLLVKAALSLSHGQADVERGFSANKLLLLEERPALKNKSIIAIRTVKDALKKYNSVEEVPLSNELFRKHRSAYSAYEKELSANAASNVATSTKKNAGDAQSYTRDSEIKKRRQEVSQKRSDTEALIDEANNRLQESLKAKQVNTKEVMAAQALLQQGTSALAEARKEVDEIEKSLAAKKPRHK